MAFTNNGFATSWSDVEVSFGTLLPVQLPSIKSIDYKWSIDRVKEYGAGQFALDYTAGIVMIDDAKMEISEFDWLVFLAAMGGLDIAMNKDLGEFDIIVNYALGPFGAIPCTDTLSQCMLKSFTQKPAQGPDPVMVEVEFTVLDIIPGNALLGTVITISL